MSFALLLGSLFFVVRSLAPQTVGETARRKLLADLREYYRGYGVTIRRGYFDPKVGLTFEDVRIRDHSTASPLRGGEEMVWIDRLTVVSDVDPTQILDHGNPLVTRGIVMDGVHATARIDEDQSISLARLLPLPKFGPVCPRIVMKNVSLSLLDDGPQQRAITVELSEVVIESNQQPGGSIERVVHLRGSSHFVDELLARVDLRVDATEVRCSIKGVQLSRDLFDRLPEPWNQYVRHALDLQCKCDATLAMRQPRDGPMDYQLRTTIHEGRFEHATLPKPISEMRGVLVCTPQGITIEASQGTFGDAIVRASGTINGYSWPCVANLSLSARGLLLDDRLANSLPEKIRRSWDRLQPLGRVDVDANIDHSSAGWKPRATIACKGVDVRYDRFPYPVESLVGRIELADGVIKAETLTGRVGGNRMQCAFQLPMQEGRAVEKSFMMGVDGPIPIDRTLLSSLSPRGAAESKLESFVRSLRPRGSIQLASAVFMTDRDGRTTRRMDLRVIDGHLQYDKFAYPLYNVTGNVLVENELVTIDQMRASNANAGTIRCDGTYRIPTRSLASQSATGSIGQSSRSNDTGPQEFADNSDLALRFIANNIPMDESLRSSLPSNSQQVWDAMAPGGVLDELEVALKLQGSGSPLSLDLTARQHDIPQVSSRTLSLRPNSLPYRLDVTGGTVRFDGKTVTIDSIKGRHDASTLSADGFCVQDATGRWELLLNLRSGSRLHPDAELIAALPSQMRVAMRALQLRGPISVRGRTRFAMPDHLHPEPSIQWDLVLQLEGNRIADVGPVHSLRGEVSVQGVRDDGAIRALGEVRIDSMHVHEIQITGIRGPFAIEGDMLYLGSVVPTLDGQTPKVDPVERESIRGRLFDGSLDLDGKVVLSSGNFDVGMTVHQAQMPTLLADFGSSDNGLTGTLTGHTHLQGNLSTADLLKGNGSGNVTGANMYQLPLIVQVLNLLRIKPTEDVAFTDGEMTFTIFGDTVTFSHLKFWGDLVELQGGGTLNRRRELDLTFNTRVSPQNTFTQLMSPLNQRYTLWTIDVHGPLHALEIERKGLDGVSETLEWLIPGMSQGNSRQASEPEQGISGWLR